VEEPKLPKFDYHLDESDPDIAMLRRQDGAFVGAFSARGAARGGIMEAAQEDCRALLEAHVRSSGEGAEQERSAKPRCRSSENPTTSIYVATTLGPGSRVGQATWRRVGSPRGIMRESGWSEKSIRTAWG
jgi:hypothetical protein